MKNKCVKCNIIFPDDMLFCSKCGSKLVKTESVTESAGKWMKSTGQKGMFAAKIAKTTISNSKAARAIVQKKDEISEKIANSYVVCEQCGEVLQPDSKFCNVCGHPVPEKKKENKLVCSECGAELKANSKFCNVCGAKVVEKKEEKPKICPSCGNELDEQDIFCSECGYRINDSDSNKYVEEERQEPFKQICMHCGSTFPEDGLFCPECGTPASVDKTEYVEFNNDIELSRENETEIIVDDDIQADSIFDEQEKKTLEEQTEELVCDEQKAITCTVCGTILPEGAMFCPECGNPIGNAVPIEELEEFDENRCNNCGEVLPDDAAFCPSCGTPV